MGFKKKVPSNQPTPPHTFFSGIALKLSPISQQIRFLKGHRF
jgi:hypothetical protein